MKLVLTIAFYHIILNTLAFLFVWGLFFFVLVLDRVSLHNLGCPRIQYIGQANLELTTICQSLPLECWDSRCVPPPPSIYTRFNLPLILQQTVMISLSLGIQKVLSQVLGAVTINRIRAKSHALLTNFLATLLVRVCHALKGEVGIEPLVPITHAPLHPFISHF